MKNVQLLLAAPPFGRQPETGSMAGRVSQRSSKLKWRRGFCGRLTEANSTKK